jgi:hypothetical protein
MLKATLVIAVILSSALAQALEAGESPRVCSPASILVETEETSLLTNSGKAWIAFDGDFYEGTLDGLVTRFDPVAMFPTRIRYLFRSERGNLLLTGYPDGMSLNPVAFNALGEPTKLLLDIAIEVNFGRLDGAIVKSEGVVMTGTLDTETKLETFVSNNVGSLCR